MFRDSFGNKSNMDQIFAQADVVSFHIPQNEKTLFMVDDEYINRFKKSVYIINLARGKIVKTLSLVEGLKSGKIKGACLDVLEFEKSSFENLFDNQNSITNEFAYLLNSSKVILSPHVGGWTVESYFKLSDVLADKILNFYS